MNPTLHPFFVHVPIAVAILLPFFIGGAIWFYRKDENSANQVWFFAAISLVIMTLFTIFSIMSGGEAEEILEKLIDEEAIEKHEEVAELFGMVVYAVTGLSLFLFIFKGKLRQTFMYAIFALSILTLGLGLYTGKTGGAAGHEAGGVYELQKAIEASGGNWKALEENEENEEEEEDHD